MTSSASLTTTEDMATTQAILAHYEDVEEAARKRLESFKSCPCSDKAIFKELTYCVFAANSSAAMAEKAVELLEPVIHTGDVDEYKDQVAGKVRFYNVRSEYTAYNHGVINGFDKDLHTIIKEQDSPRRSVKKLFKGVGMKEASHFLRNIGHSGYCILDKHVRQVMCDIDVLNSTSYPSRPDEYEEAERRIQAFCDANGLDVDVFDLAVWSYKTGRIAK